MKTGVIKNKEEVVLKIKLGGHPPPNRDENQNSSPLRGEDELNHLLMEIVDFSNDLHQAELGGVALLGSRRHQLLLLLLLHQLLLLLLLLLQLLGALLLIIVVVIVAGGHLEGNPHGSPQARELALLLSN